MEYYNNVLCVSGSELFSAGIKAGTYNSWATRGKINVIRRACYATPALIEFNSLPTPARSVITEKYGEIEDAMKRKAFKDSIKTDAAALRFYSEFCLADGRKLTPDKIAEYTINASVLNRVNEIINNRVVLRKALGGSVRDVWGCLADQVAEVKAELKHTLPENVTRLKTKLKEYRDMKYRALIHKGFCNDNSRKVSLNIERLILALYSRPNRPFMASVFEDYNKFIAGTLDVVDVATGELFDRKDFTNEDGTPIVLSDATIKNLINNPENRIAVDSKRMGKLEFSSAHRPHHHRHRPNFSFSKISMDDRDLPRKSDNGKRVKAYYSYDLTSGCVIGASFSYDKDLSLIYDCFRDMFQFINRNGFGMPLECEVEHHLMNKIEGQLNTMFKYVRFCNAGNSQEKGAEHMNRAKKYTVEKKNHNDIGRWWARGEAYRTRTERINDEYAEKTYSYAALVADDKADIKEYNNALHPNQKLYKGMTRLDVLKAYMNPDAIRFDSMTPADRAHFVKVIGEQTKTSIQRNQYLQVQYSDYQLSSPAILGSLRPNNRTVTAYYLPDENGEVKDVYIYQGENFIDYCQKITAYNEAKAEQTPADRKAYTEQSKYVSAFDKLVKESRPGRVELIDNDLKDSIMNAEVIIAAPVDMEQPALNDWQNNDWDNFDPEDIRKEALRTL